MKNYKIFITYTVALVFLLSSCSKEFLDRQPLDQKVSTNFYQTEEDAKQAVVAVYDAMDTNHPQV